MLARCTGSWFISMNMRSLAGMVSRLRLIGAIYTDSMLRGITPAPALP